MREYACQFWRPTHWVRSMPPTTASQRAASWGRSCCWATSPPYSVSATSSKRSSRSRTSEARKRRWPPSVRSAVSFCERAHRVTVFGLTRNIEATSAGVRRSDSTEIDIKEDLSSGLLNNGREGEFSRYLAELVIQ